MTREKEIKNEAHECYNTGIERMLFEHGAHRADEHPKDKRAQQQELFDELNPYEKADFMKNNIEWARTRDLFNELKLRNEL